MRYLAKQKSMPRFAKGERDSPNGRRSKRAIAKSLNASGCAASSCFGRGRLGVGKNSIPRNAGAMRPRVAGRSPAMSSEYKGDIGERPWLLLTCGRGIDEVQFQKPQSHQGTASAIEARERHDLWFRGSLIKTEEDHTHHVKALSLPSSHTNISPSTKCAVLPHSIRQAFSAPPSS